MAQGGEFAFVLFAAATAEGVIDQTINANRQRIVGAFDGVYTDYINSL